MKINKMKINCFGCGIEKDTDILEVSPFAKEDYLIDDPIEPLFILDCEGDPIPNDPNNYSEYRMVVVCHVCFHALSPDMWIGKECWESINPKVPYDKLPMYVSGLTDPTLLKPLS
jgi:hypothetical protein